MRRPSPRSRPAPDTAPPPRDGSQIPPHPADFPAAPTVERATSDGGDLTPETVLAAYRRLLGRTPTDAEVALQLTGCLTLDALLQTIVASAEFIQKRGRGAEELTPDPRVLNMHVPGLERWSHPVGTTSEDGVAQVGRDGWLFLVGGTNAVLDQHRGQSGLDDGWEPAWQTAASTRLADARALGIPYLGLIVPDKLGVLAEHFPGPLLDLAESPAGRLAARPELELLYPAAELREATEPAYLRTDTHFSLAGNALLANLVAERLNAPTVSPPADTVQYLASGDLGGRFRPAIVEVISTINGWGSAEIVENRTAVLDAGGHVGTRVITRNPSASDARRLVIFGDSYSYASTGYQGLMWWLAQVFAEVHFAWIPFGWDPDYLQRVRADAVICQGAERFVRRPPEPRVDVVGLEAETLARLGTVR